MLCMTSGRSGRMCSGPLASTCCQDSCTAEWPDAQAARMDADDFLVVRPDLHQADAVRLFQGFVERVLGFVWRGEHRSWRLA